MRSKIYLSQQMFGMDEGDQKRDGYKDQAQGHPTEMTSRILDLDTSTGSQSSEMAWIRLDDQTEYHLTEMTAIGLNSSANPWSVEPRQYWTIFLLIFPALTVFGNILVCLSVYKEKTLQTVTNFFIVSLAIADIMVAILVMPLAVYVEVSDIMGAILVLLQCMLG